MHVFISYVYSHIDFIFKKLLLFQLICYFLKNPSGNPAYGAPAMLGCKSGFQSLVKKVTPEVIGTHCIIHQIVLATKTLLEPFKALD